MVKVDKFIFEVGDKKIELSEEECMELKNKLNELFGRETIVYPYIPQPIYPDPKPMFPSPNWYDTEITC